MQQQILTAIQGLKKTTHFGLLIDQYPVYDRIKSKVHSSSFAGFTLNICGPRYCIIGKKTTISMNDNMSAVDIGSFAELIDHKEDTNSNAGNYNAISYSFISLIRLELLLKWVIDNPNEDFKGIVSYLQNTEYLKF